jgi:hypothetical protein
MNAHEYSVGSGVTNKVAFQQLQGETKFTFAHGNSPPRNETLLEDQPYLQMQKAMVSTNF